jgi:hypothetical protein
MKKSTLDKKLIEGYKYSAENDSQLINDFSHIDAENWEDGYSNIKNLNHILEIDSGIGENELKKPCKTTAK